MAARQPSDALCDRVYALCEPFDDTRMVTLGAIMLRRRLAMTMPEWVGVVSADLDALCKAWVWPCA